jgi:hypothetical protein
VGASYEVMPTWTLGGTIGYYDFDDDGVDGTDTSYMHYQIDENGYSNHQAVQAR